MPCLTLWESTTLVYLAIYSCCRQWFCAIVATHVLASITSSERRGQDSMHAHTQYLGSTLDVTHVIKCTRLSPSLVGRAWEQDYLTSTSMCTMHMWLLTFFLVCVITICNSGTYNTLICTHVHTHQQHLKFEKLLHVPVVWIKPTTWMHFEP